MANSLPSRPNLDHLRRQAKVLLASVASGDADAIATIRQFLPAAKGMSDAAVRQADLRLADAQSAIARKSGFDAWPQLARYVEQLRTLEGTWSFVRLEVDGSAIPPEAMRSSRLMMDGDRFRMESPEGVYEGVFNIDVEAQPHQIDIEFIEGPEAGNWNYGIFRFDGDDLVLCLDMAGKPHPKDFRTTPGSGLACETLRRESGARSASVTGGTRAAASPSAPAPQPDAAAFAYAPSETLTKLQGEWSAQKIVRDGDELMWVMRKTAKRSAKGNEVKISVMGQVIIHALVRIDERATPMHIDYHNLAGAAKGTIQHGVMEWRGEEACFCMAAPGQPRPADFECAKGSGRTFSQWRRKT